MANQLGLDPVEIAGTGPDGSRTLVDVLRRAGREPPAAARPPRPRRVAGTGGVDDTNVRKVETACDAGPIEDARDALAVVGAVRPDAFDIVVRLCAVALRDVPSLTGIGTRAGDGSGRESIDLLAIGPAGTGWVRAADRAGIMTIRESMRAASSPPESASPAPTPGSATEFIVRAENGPAALPRDPSADSDRSSGAVLTVGERPGSIVLDLEFAAIPEQDGERFLSRLGELCRDPRRALL